MACQPLRHQVRSSGGRSLSHRASRYALDTRYGLEYWCGSETLEEIVRAPWPWLSIPIWRYELQAHMLMRLDTLH